MWRGRARLATKQKSDLQLPPRPSAHKPPTIRKPMQQQCLQAQSTLRPQPAPPPQAESSAQLTPIVPRTRTHVLTPSPMEQSPAAQKETSTQSLQSARPQLAPAPRVQPKPPPLR